MLRNFYVDDMLMSTDSVKDGIQLVNEVNPNQLNVGLQRPNKFSNVKLYTILFSK